MPIVLANCRERAVLQLGIAVGGGRFVKYKFVLCTLYFSILPVKVEIAPDFSSSLVHVFLSQIFLFLHYEGRCLYKKYKNNIIGHFVNSVLDEQNK